MRKFMVYSLWFIVIVLTIYHLPYTIYPVFAADSTPSADIQTKLKQLETEIASKAANLKQQLNKKLENKAYVGTLKTHSATSLTLASSSGPKLVNLNQDTDFKSNIKSKKAFSADTLADEMYIAALGDIDETQVLTARQIVLLTKPSGAHKSFLWGKVASIDGRLATLLDRTSKTMAISNSSDTDIRVGDFIIATGKMGENDIFEAGFVFVIPQGGTLRPKKTASSSAQVSPKPTSSSAKAK